MKRFFPGCFSSALCAKPSAHGGVGIGFRVIVFAFLAVNLWCRFWAIFDHSGFITGLFVFLGICSVLVILFPRYLKTFLLVFGVSFFLFGFRPYDIQSQVFETVVVFSALTVFFVNLRRVSGELLAVGRGQGTDGRGQRIEDGGRRTEGRGQRTEGRGQRAEGRGQRTEGRGQRAEDGGGQVSGRDNGRINRPLVALILCYIGLSVLSLQLLPVGHIVKDFWLFGLRGFFLQVANAAPGDHLYSVGGINRLILYFVFALEVARGKAARELYKGMFVGVFSGAVFCAFIGMLDHYGMFSLSWYTKNVLPGNTSTFPSSGWFSEYILTVVPFVLIGFMSKTKGVYLKAAMFAALLICEISLIQAQARAGWVSYPLVLIFCWLFLYLSREGRLESFRFKWRDLVVVGLSAPITIVVSLLLLFLVLDPLSDLSKSAVIDKAPQGESKKPTTQKVVLEKNKRAESRTSKQKTQQPPDLAGESIPAKVSVEGEIDPATQGGGNRREKDFIAKIAGGKIKRAADLVTPRPGGRIYTWTEGFTVGRESPLLGMGYESFCWHANILAEIPESYFAKFKGKWLHDTPHSIFFQLFVSGGIVGLLMWLVVIGFSITIMIADLIKHKRLLNIPVIISIISFHIYGIFQSMQYIPMIWMLIFINLGYAMTIDEDVLPEKLRRITGVVVKVMICFVLIGGVVYFSGRGSQGLAEKYGLEVYGKDQDWHNYSGFYHKENWGKGFYRWSGRKGRVVIADCGLRVGELEKQKARGMGDGCVVEFDFVCGTPGIEVEPVRLMISLDGKRIDEIVFRANGGVKRRYYVRGERQGAGSEKGRKHEFVFEVSRTWNPKKLGISRDVRDLGVAVSEPRFLSKLPEDGVGFYKWERVQLSGGSGQEVRRFRWTGGRASVPIAQSLTLKAQSKGGGKDGGRKTEDG